MHRVVLGTLTRIVSDVLSDYDKHFELSMSGTLDNHEQDCLREAVLVYLWLCKIKHLQDIAKSKPTAKSALILFLRECANAPN